MDAAQIKKLKSFGINTNNCSIEIFEDLLNLTEYLYNELEAREIDRFRKELKRLKHPTS